MRDLKKVRLKKEFVEDYNKSIRKLFFFLYPLLQKGWNEEEVFQLVLYMEKNKKEVKNKKLDEILILYKDYRLKKAKRKKI